MNKLSLPEKFQSIEEPWRPKVLAALNGQEIKLVRVHGVFPWHTHEAEDEFFLVWSGVFRVEFRDQSIDLQAGECTLVPRGVEHRTASDAGAEVLCFEPAGVINTGSAERTEFTAPNCVHI